MSPSAERYAPLASDEQQGRYLCLCFDGTGNKFGENSNVVRFFRAIKKDIPNVQIPYYQVWTNSSILRLYELNGMKAGVGTYNKRQFHTRTLTAVASVLDQAVALHLNDHVKDGYKFLMQNYRPGDKICLFGFSRGAYTARALAGMLHKVGLLPQDNDQQLDFAFTIYQSTDMSAAVTSKEFKDHFSIHVKVEFLGVWDTVSSVGILPRVLPYSSACYNVKTFRHALALDERRARFRPNIWGEPTVRQEVVDHDGELVLPPSHNRGNWVYEPPELNIDIKEVWFSGCHADVGGGSHRKEESESLSNIPLRWMIKECQAKTGLVFDEDYLRGIGVDIHTPQAIDPYHVKPEIDRPTIHNSIARQGGLDLLTRGHRRDYTDALAWIYDQLDHVPAWRILEYIPMLVTSLNPNGTWVRRRMPNYCAGRVIPPRDDVVYVHRSVQERMNRTQSDPDRYKPRAQNWDNISGIIEWVD
ncbi:hypothetical protein OE88DRAFT_1738368 [Heliocybe sulcata]|uniref:T6SS Phospholipase effector Tle1-like catalytic domain-containing protein n=1 Tax=Heliocybe sulcata TaxID=5364 RepID=A0A5C3MRA6_9AGAM|nr:hypothetical protein OE88DRAFT_1738368 [Heliocybe sulcata]